MSTLGKVLVVLVTLAMLGWIFLAALVAEHHSNWGEVIKKTKSEIAEIEPLLAPMQDKIDRTLAAASLSQVSLDRARRNFRGEYASLQRQESEFKETMSRDSLQLTLAEEEAVNSEKRAQVRAAEKTDFERKIAQEETKVAELVAETGKLRDQYEGLIKSFLETQAENKAYVDRLKKTQPVGVGPRTRLGSFTR